MDIKSVFNKFLDVFFIRDLLDLKRGRFWVKWTRIFAIAVREFVKDNCSLRASALTFVTLVSIVPVLAFAFSVGKGLGFHEHLKEFLMKKVTTGLGFEGEAGAGQIVIVLEKIFDYVDKTNFQTLGAIGTVMLIYLVIRLLGYIEKTFNDIWGVAVQRSIIRKFSDYLSIVIVFPLFVLLAATGTAALTSHKFLELLNNLGSAGLLFKLLLRYSPYFFLWIAFIAVYMVMPNTRVPFSSALVGGVVGGTSWQIAQWVYFHFQVSISRYNAIYSTVAALPIFLLWLQLSWMVLLFGAEVAFAHQMVKSYRFVNAGAIAGRKASEVLALSIVAMIARNFFAGKKPIGIKQFSEALGVKPEVIKPIIASLCKKEIIFDTSGNDNSYLLSLSPDKLSTIDVLEAVSGDYKSEINTNRISPEIYRFFEDIDETLNSKYKTHTIANLVQKE
jgi:membrane protein